RRHRRLPAARPAVALGPGTGPAAAGSAVGTEHACVGPVLRGAFCPLAAAWVQHPDAAAARTARLCVRRRPGAVRVQAPHWAEAALLRQPRSRARDESAGRAPVLRRRSRALVRPIREARAELARLAVERPDRRGPVDAEGEVVCLAAADAVAHVHVQKRGHVDRVGQGRADDRTRAAHRDVRSADRSSPDLEPDAVPPSRRGAERRPAGRERARRHRRRRRDVDAGVEGADGHLAAPGRDPVDTGRIASPRDARGHVDRPEPPESRLSEFGAGRLDRSDRSGYAHGSRAAEARLPVIAHLAAAAAAVALAPHASPGVTATTITIGGTVPLSGPATAFGSVGPRAHASFQYVNAQGGVHGRKIVYKYLDDGYEPARTVLLTQQLIEQDKVFALFDTVGTDNALAIRGYVNDRKVPDLFVGSGVSTIAREHAKYPWTMGYLPSTIGEGLVDGRRIAQVTPRAKIAVLYEDSSFGTDLLSGLRRGLHGKAKIVAQQSYDPNGTDVSSQIARLRGSHADTLILFATPLFAIKAYVGANRL